MPWFHFHQNNSGGRYRNDHARGIGHDVWIEGRDVDDANRRAEGIGLYFDGCDTGQDCSCCGDRWSRAYQFRDEPQGDDLGEMAEGYYAPSEGKPVFLHPVAGDFITLTHDMPHGRDDVLRLVEERTYARDEAFVREWIAKHGVPEPSALPVLAGRS